MILNVLEEEKREVAADKGVFMVNTGKVGDFENIITNREPGGVFS